MEGGGLPPQGGHNQSESYGYHKDNPNGHKKLKQTKFYPLIACFSQIIGIFIFFPA